MRNLFLVIDLSSARIRRNSANDDTNPFPGLEVPRLNNDQMRQLKGFTVVANTGRPQKELLQFYERLLPCGTPYWWREGIEWYRIDVVEEHVARSLVPGARKQRMLKRKQFDGTMRTFITRERFAKLDEALEIEMHGFERK